MSSYEGATGGPPSRRRSLRRLAPDEQRLKVRAELRPGLLLGLHAVDKALNQGGFEVGMLRGRSFEVVLETLPSLLLEVHQVLDRFPWWVLWLGHRGSLARLSSAFIDFQLTTKRCGCLIPWSRLFAVSKLRAFDLQGSNAFLDSCLLILPPLRPQQPFTLRCFDHASV